MVEKKPLRHGVLDGAVDGCCSGGLVAPGEVVFRASWASAVLVPSVFSETEELGVEDPSDFLFLFLRKFPLSNIFSQLGSRVQ